MKDGSDASCLQTRTCGSISDTGVIVAAPITRPTEGDTATLDPTRKEAEKNLSGVGFAPTPPEDPCDLVADKGYHSRDVLKETRRRPVEDAHRRTPAERGLFTLARRRRGARGGLWEMSNGLKCGVGREAMRKRGELVKRRLRPCSGTRRHAPHVVARSRERP